MSIRSLRPLALAAALLGSVAHAVPTSTATFTAASTPPLRINEVLASRSGAPATSPDLIELHNTGPTAIDLTGKSLTDDPALPRKFIFPAGTTIPAGGYLVVNATTTVGPLNTGFALDAEGDVIRLHDSTTGNPLLDEIRFGFQVLDLSISRTGEAGNVWALTNATPGAANAAPVALGNVAGLRINEWAAKIVFRLDHDMIELFNPVGQPVALAGVRLTDNVNLPNRFTFPALSFIPANPSGFLPLYGADFVFGLDADRETVTLFGENNEQIDQVVVQSQPADRSSGRNPDGSATLVDFAVPTPGFSNTTPVPSSPVNYQDLLNYLRITEIMFDPVADNNASQFEFVELQNIGPVSLNLSGVRFTNGIEHEFPAGTTLAPGAFLVVVNDRSSFRARYPHVPESQIATGGFNGALSNEGETLALTLPAPWRVHILRFRFEPTWYPSTARGGHSLVPVSAATAAPQDWQQPTAWRASTAINGSPGAADPNPSTGTPGSSRLANLSVRTSLAASQTLIVGTTVSGRSTRLLVRAAGPALAALGLPGAMTDPRLELHQNGTRVFENNDWPANLADAFTSVAAFPFPVGSRDAAFDRDIDGGPTIQVTGTGPGVVLVEVYDRGTGSPGRLTNVSARNLVGTGDNILIAGFNISGTGDKPLLIRGVGPKLTAFGVTGVLNDPRLEIYNSAGVRIADNDNWPAALAPTFTTVGAFALDANSRDAALETRLPPGSYTVQVSGVGNTTGEALIELYELP